MPELERYITYGASPRASINLILTARALAFVRGRDYALPQDVLGHGARRDAPPPGAVVRGALRRRHRRRPADRRSSTASPRRSSRSGSRPTSAPAPERILQRLDWQVVRRLDGLLQGDYRSLFHGNGVDLADLREYQPGDDVRYIDWNVTARMDTPYVRQYHEDREITAWFLLDLSPSVDFGTVDAEREKRTVLIDFVTTLARLLTRHGNRVGAMFYGGQVERTIPARGGPDPGAPARPRPARPAAPRRRAVHRPDAAARRRPTGDQATLAGRSSSPTSSARPGWERSLELLSRRHEVLAVRLVDPREIELPDVGPLIMEDAETGEQLYVDTARPGLPAAVPRRPPTRARRAIATPSGEPASTPSRCRPTRTSSGRSCGWRCSAGGAGGRQPMSFLWPQMLLAARPRPARRPGSTGPSSGDAGGTSGRVGARAWPRAAGHAAGRRRSGRQRAPGRPVRSPGLTILTLSPWPGRRRRSPCPASEGTVILAFDVSRSMAADDLEPTRMDAAKAATQGVRRAPAAGRRHRGRRLQRRRPLGPGADQRPGRDPGRDRPPGAGARDVARPGDPGRARRDRHRRGRTADRLLHQPLARADAASRRPVPPGVARAGGRSSCSPTARTTSDPTRSTAAQAAAGPRRPDLHGRHRQPPPGRRSTSTGSRSTPSSTRRLLQQDLGGHRRDLLGADDAEALSSGLRRARPAPRRSSPRRSRSPRCSPARGPLPAGRRAVARCWPGSAAMTAQRGRGRGRTDELPVARAPRPARARADPRRSSTSGASAGADRRRARYSSLSLVRDASPGSSRLRRHLPFALFALAVAALVARPRRGRSRSSAVPTNQTTIILTIDVSRSMCSTDIAPNRLAGRRGRGRGVRPAARAEDADRDRRVQRLRRARSSRRRPTRRSCSTRSRA